MPTYSSVVRLYNKKILPLDQFKDNFLEYLRAYIREVQGANYDRDCTIGSTKVPVVAGAGVNTVDIAQGGGTYKGANGEGYIIQPGVNDLTLQGIKIPTDVGIIFHIGLEPAFVPNGLETNPRTGEIEYRTMKEVFGRTATPVSVVNGGTTLTVDCDSIFGAGDHSGRKVTIWLKPKQDGGLVGPQSTDPAVAIETRTVTYFGGSNIIITDALLGQNPAGVSETEADYVICAQGPTVVNSNNEDLRDTDGVWFIGQATGVGAGNPVVTMNTTDQRLANTTLADFATVFRRDAHDSVKVRVIADASDADEPQLEVQNSSAVTVFKVDEDGDVTVSGDLSIVGDLNVENLTVNTLLTTDDGLVTGVLDAESIDRAGSMEVGLSTGSLKLGFTGAVDIVNSGGDAALNVSCVTTLTNTLNVSNINGPAGLSVGAAPGFVTNLGAGGAWKVLSDGTLEALSEEFISNVKNPVLAQDATNKRYADAGDQGNLLINSDFQIKQRGVGPFAFSATRAFGPDRWYGYCGGVGAGELSIQTAGNGFFNQALRCQRPAADASVVARYLAQEINRDWLQDSTNGLFSPRTYGRTLTLSGWYRTGANFSAAAVDVLLATGTDAVPVNIQTGYTGSVSHIVSTLPPTAGVWTYFDGASIGVTGTINSTVSQMAIRFGWTPTGVAGANDWVEFSGLMLNAGPVAAPWQPAGDELRLCQRYYEKSFTLTDGPGGATGAHNTNALNVLTNNGSLWPIGVHPRFSVEKYKVPSVLVYATGINTPGLWSLDGVSRTSIATAVDRLGFLVANDTGGAVTPTLGRATGQWIADGEI